MSSDAPHDGCEVKLSRSLSALLSDDSVRIFVPETSAMGAALCLIAGTVLYWMGLFSVL
ncbi:MAG: hypothetical protein U0936_01945 [Planctomycetaceae bacterium]